MCKICHAKDVRDVRLKNKRRAVESKGGACQVCGYNRCLNNLVFHHLDAKTKSNKLRMKNRSGHVHSVTGFVRKWDLIEKEIKKCVLVCKNCHGEIEAGLLDISAILVIKGKEDEVNQAIRNIFAREQVTQRTS